MLSKYLLAFKKFSDVNLKCLIEIEKMEKHKKGFISSFVPCSMLENCQRDTSTFVGSPKESKDPKDLKDPTTSIFIIDVINPVIHTSS
jgi:hypothetical protein